MAPPANLTLGEKVKFAFSSPSNFHRAIVLDSAAGKLINEDLVPSPSERQTWTAWDYFAYWWSEAWAVSTWSLGSSLVAVGLSVGEAILVILFANILCAVVIVFNGVAASRYHIGYPVLSRPTYGIYGSYVFVAFRSVLGVIWAGFQIYFGGYFISIILRCIFSSFNDMKNTIPLSSNVTTQNLIGYILAFLFTLPFMSIHTSKLRLLFTIKSFVVPIASLGTIIWATKANGGVSSGTIETPASKGISTTAFAFSVMSQFNSVMGSNSALIVTVPDLARYARNGRHQMYGQLVGLPLSIICAAFGCITTSAVLNMWGKSYWNLYDLLNGILDEQYTPKARAGVFFASAVWAFATFCTSVACNITPFASDVTCMLPKYINIVRGQFICVIIATATTPWNLLTSAQSFLSFLGGYSIFQGSVVSIMIVDYFLVRRGNLDIEAMYDESSSGKYYFVYGVNWRAVAAFVAGFALPLPGFIGSFGTASVSSSATYMYDLGWELSFVVGGLVYWVLCLVFPVPGQEDCRKPFGEMIDDDWTLPNGLTKTGGHVNSNIEAIEDKDGSRDIVLPA